MQAGMFPQAIALLEQEITEKPTNVDAHFQLGVCYINQGNHNGADARFASAVRLNPDYGFKIGNEYRKVADFSLNKGKSSSLRTLYDKAINYDPRLRKDIAQKLFQKGKQNGNDDLLSLSVSYDNGLRNNIAEHYYTRSQETSGGLSLSLLKKANDYSGGLYQTEIPKKAFEVCDSISSFDEKMKCIEENKNYLNEKSIFELSVKYYSKILGTPGIAELNEVDDWKFVIHAKDGDRIEYLSLESFMSKQGNNKKKWRSAITQTNDLFFMAEPILTFGSEKTIKIQ